MVIYIVECDEDVVEPVQLPDNRYNNEDLEDSYGVYFLTYEEAKEHLDDYFKGIK